MSNPNPLAEPKVLGRVIDFHLDKRPPSQVQEDIVRRYANRQAGGRMTWSVGNPSPQFVVAAFVASTKFTDDEKLRILNPVLTAVKGGDYSALIVESGDEPKPETGSRVNPLTIDVVPQPAPVAPVAPAAEKPAVGSGDAAVEIAEAIKRLAASVVAQPTAPAIDRDAVVKIVDEVMGAKLDEALKAAQSAGIHRIEVKAGDEVRPVSGIAHRQLPEVLTWVSADVPVWLWGAAGGGKTHMARQIAEGLGLKPYIVSVDPTITVGKLVGYRNLATGDFVEGLLYRPYKDGGLLMLDEIDTGDPGIIACLNSLLANGHYLFPNGEEVERHPKFRIIAGANTKGVGAVAGYTARQRLDAATLNRFAIVELKYDERMEELLAVGKSDLPATPWVAGKMAADGDAKWVAWVRKVRAQVGSAVLVSPRASYLGVRALRAGVPVGEVAEALVFALCSADTKTNITRACGGPNG